MSPTLACLVLMMGLDWVGVLPMTTAQLLWVFLWLQVWRVGLALGDAAYDAVVRCWRG